MFPVLRFCGIKLEKQCGLAGFHSNLDMYTAGRKHQGKKKCREVKVIEANMETTSTVPYFDGKNFPRIFCRKPITN